MEIKSLYCASREAAITRLRHLCAAPDAVIGVVPAAGLGARSGLSIPKQYHLLLGQAVLARSVRALASEPFVQAVVVVLNPQDNDWQTCGLEKALEGFQHVLAVPIGGASRRDSVMAGCDLIQHAVGDANPWVMVHDAARPGVTAHSLKRLWAAVAPLSPQCGDGAILAVPVADTIKRAAGLAQAVVQETVNRDGLWAAQTPQVFRLQPLLAAYRANPAATDEASAIESQGGKVALVVGDATNFKLTKPDDFSLMEALMAQTDSELPFAVGQGFDVHALVSGRPLILGGVTIPFDKGLDGHSDADALLHAITDAILGAACMGDIGRLFPDTDPAFKGADSRVLLRTAVEKVKANGWAVAHIDATVIAQAPKISPYALAMQDTIAACCGLDARCVNIKGKTTEKLGFTGRGEGIAAQAMATLKRVRG